MPPVAVRFSNWLSGVSLPGKYGLVAALILCAYLFYHTGRTFLAWSLKLQRAVSWRRLLQSPVPDILYCLDIFSYTQCILVAVLFASNVMVLVFTARSFTEIQKRAGAMAVISLFPLFSGPTFSLTSSLCRLSRDTLAWTHRWVGRICLVHCFIHSTIIVGLVRQSVPLSGSYWAAVGATIAFLAILPVTCAAMLRHHPQLMLKLHYLLAICGAAILAYHLRHVRSIYLWVLLGGIGLWIVSWCALWIQLMCILGSWRRIRFQAKAKVSKQLLWLEIRAPRQWNLQAGQHVQLWIPHSGYRSCLYLPLFYVAHVEDREHQENDDTPIAFRRLHLLARHQRGLSQRLAWDTMQANQSFSVFMFGPFGDPPGFGQYGTVLFVVEDIGLFRILPFIRQLVHGSRRRETAVRKLEILWVVDWDSIVELELLPELEGRGAEPAAHHAPHTFQRSEYKSWIRDSIQRLFELDRQLHSGPRAGEAPVDSGCAGQQHSGPEMGGFDILQMSIYCPDAPRESHGRFPQTSRIQTRFENFAATREIKGYLDHQCGQMVIAVCAGVPIRKEVEDASRPKIGEDLRFVSLNLEPAAEWKGDGIPTGSLQKTSVAHRVVPAGPSGGSLGTAKGYAPGHGTSDHSKFVMQRIVQGARAR